MARELEYVRPGQPITAQLYNELVAEVRRLRRIAAGSGVKLATSESGLQLDLARNPAYLDLVDLDATIEAGNKDKAANLLKYDGGGPDLWTASTQDLKFTCDPQQGLYLAGERHLTLWHSGAGQRIPLPGVQFHLGKTDAAISAGGSGTVSVWRVNSGNHADSTFNVTAYDWLGSGIATNTAVYLFQHLQSRRWYAFPQPPAGGGGGSAVYSYSGLERDTFWRYNRGTNPTAPVLKFDFDGTQPDFDSSSSTSDDSLQAGTEGAYSFHFSTSVERSSPGTSSNIGPFCQFYIYINDGSDGILPIGQMNAPTIASEAARFRLASNHILLALAGDEFDIRVEAEEDIDLFLTYFHMHYIGPES